MLIAIVSLFWFVILLIAIKFNVNVHNNIRPNINNDITIFKQNNEGASGPNTFFAFTLNFAEHSACGADGTKFCSIDKFKSLKDRELCPVLEFYRALSSPYEKIVFKYIYRLDISRTKQVILEDLIDNKLRRIIQQNYVLIILLCIILWFYYGRLVTRKNPR